MTVLNEYQTIKISKVVENNKEYSEKSEILQASLVDCESEHLVSDVINIDQDEQLSNGQKCTTQNGGLDSVQEEVVRPKKPSKLKKLGKAKARHEDVKLVDVEDLEDKVDCGDVTNENNSGSDRREIDERGSKPVEVCNRNNGKDKEIDDPDALPSKPPKGCRAITSFFASGPKKFVEQKPKVKEDHKDVVTVAEVHPNTGVSIS